VIAELCARGYADRIVMSHDHTSYLDWLYVAPEHADVGAGGYTVVSDHAVPGLRARGVSEADIVQLTVTTPARILGGLAAGGY
jgi:phosphotriesterase-related protein